MTAAGEVSPGASRAIVTQRQAASTVELSLSVVMGG